MHTSARFVAALSRAVVNNIHRKTSQIFPRHNALDRVVHLSNRVQLTLFTRHSSSSFTRGDGFDGLNWPEDDDLADFDTADRRFQQRDRQPRRTSSNVRDTNDEDEWDFDGEQYRPRSRPGNYRDKYSRDRPRRSNSFRDRRSSYRDDDFDDYEFDGDRFNSRRRSFRNEGFDSRYSDSMGGLGSGLKTHDWSSRQLGAFEKNFYVEHPALQEMSEAELAAFYKTHDVTVSRGERVKPILDFLHANFPEKINKYVSGLPWIAPTPIQSLGWPIALSGKNMVAIAQTGSGKTLGFALPALVHIKHQRQVARGEGPVVLVLAPTRELTQQITSVCNEFGRLMGVRSTAVFGGQSKMVQAGRISEGPEIVVASPGRLLDFLESGVISLERTTYLVLDEADRMLDMGFEPQIRKILSQIRPDRQMLLWSATWPEEIQQLAHDFLGKDFMQVNIGSAQLVANPNIQQDIRVCEGREKFRLLSQELEQTDGVKTLVFVQTKFNADILTKRLRRAGFSALAIHGDKSQRIRDQTMNRFKNDDVEILVATDVASRGLDVNDIELVVNYDYPNTADDYIHRIGRTARGQKSGRALTFITDDDAGKVKDLVSVLTNAGQDVPYELQDMVELHRKLNRRKGSYKPRPSYHRRPPHFKGYRDW